MSDETFTRPSKSHLMTYRIARGEQGVLTYEPYKSYLLPHWRFRTVPIARTSSETLWTKFLQFCEDDDFVGMDMTRKFIQMGMTRAKRYANYKGGRKYIGGKEKGLQKEKSEGHEGKEEKEEASRVFREVWERCKSHEGYGELKKDFLRDQKEWDELEKEVKGADETRVSIGRKPRKDQREPASEIMAKRERGKRIKLEKQ